MSEQPPHPRTESLRALRDLEPGTYVLAWAAPAADPLGPTQPPTVGRVGAGEAGFDTGRLSGAETVRGGPAQALARWTLLEGGRRQLAILASDPQTAGGVREYTPGELVRTHVADTSDARLTGVLAAWLQRRNTGPLQQRDFGWIAPAIAWACHMRDFTPAPPQAVIEQALGSARTPNTVAQGLITETALHVADMLERLQHTNRDREGLVVDWKGLTPLAEDVPVLGESAQWLLDQIALRDAAAQQLRAVLEPDITDHLNDREATARTSRTPAPPLDPQRTAQLEQARATVRAYTAAAYSGHSNDAQHLLDALPIPARTLQPSAPAAAWRRASFTARDAALSLAAQRQGSLEDAAHPERVHADAAYWQAREAQLQHLHDAFGRLAAQTDVPHLLPAELAGIVAGQREHRIREAFGTTDRARQFLTGQLAYLQQEPVPPYRRTTTAGEVERLASVLARLDELPTTAEAGLDEGRIRERLARAMARPQPRHENTGLEAVETPTPAAQAAHPHSYTPDPSTPGVRR
ncbi:hypothetical protein ACFU5O_36875 [Streptomyces sp. NPDC057445]|uniref:hypothetical protein n=1 Tax=Streptomyces sp. NPDC057445 TaxID=3346136 RepID=UPI0036816B16